MTPGAIASRNANATDRMKTAAATLAERFGVDVSVLSVPSVGGPEVKALKEREGVAELLEALVERTGAMREMDKPAPVAARKRKAS